MAEQIFSTDIERKRFPTHGWIGLALVLVFWLINWTAPGARTAWAFFPNWLGYCLVVDALVLRRTGTSLLARSWKRYMGLFAISAPVWWLFEVLNWRVRNWHYDGRDLFTDGQYFLLASISFSVVIPAVFGTAELFSSFAFVRRLKPWLVIRPDRKTTLGFFFSGLIMLALMLAWPRYFFPFLWLSGYFILEPVNVWLGFRNMAEHTREGDWRPVVSLFLGVLATGFFWEMWNYYSFPKWVYTVPGVNFLHVFEMPLLGYGGYLPFSLELAAVYHFVTGALRRRRDAYVRLDQESPPLRDL